MCPFGCIHATLFMLLHVHPCVCTPHHPSANHRPENVNTCTSVVSCNANCEYQYQQVWYRAICEYRQVLYRAMELSASAVGNIHPSSPFRHPSLPPSKPPPMAFANVPHLAMRNIATALISTVLSEKTYCGQLLTFMTHHQGPSNTIQWQLALGSIGIKFHCIQCIAMYHI